MESPTLVMGLINCFQSLRSASEDEAAEREAELAAYKVGGQELTDETKGELESALRAALDYGIRRYGISVNNGYPIFSKIARIGRHYKLIQGPQPFTGTFSVPGSLGRGNTANMPHIISPMSSDEECLGNGRLQPLPEQSHTLAVGIYRVGFTEAVSILVRLIFVDQSYEGPISKSMEPEVCLPTTILKGRMELLATSPDDILFGTIPRENEIERGRVLRELKYIKPGCRIDLSSNIRLRRGSSIGSLDNADRGTAGVYLQSVTTGATKLLTAAHAVIPHVRLTPDPLTVVPNLEVIPEPICSPGNVDILKYFASLREKPIGLQSEGPTQAVLDQWVQAYRRKIGTSGMYAIGVGTNGFRSDWALIDLEPGVAGGNDEWWGRGQFHVEWLLAQEGVAESEAEKFNGQTISTRDPTPDDGCIWLKDGSSTGWTSGRCVDILTELFLKSSAASANPPTDSPPKIPPSIITAKVLSFIGNNGHCFAESGDSGAAVLGVQAEDATAGMAFGGLVVSAFVADNGRENITFVVPAGKVLEQVAEATGEEWVLA